MDMEEALSSFKNIFGRLQELMIGHDDPEPDHDLIDNQETPTMTVPTFYSIIPESDLERFQMLWASFSITGSPLVWGAAFGLIYADEESEDASSSSKVYAMLGWTFSVLSLCTVPVYTISRIILLILAFVELRDVPSGALATIHWSNVLPFIH